MGWNKINQDKSIIWKGKGLDEVGMRADTGEVVVRVDPRYFRLTEVQTLLGDPTNAKIKLGWQPRITLEDMIKEMISYDTKEAEKEIILKNKGYKIFNSVESIPSNDNENK